MVFIRFIDGGGAVLVTVGVFLIVLAVLMFVGLLLIDNQSLVILLIYGFTVVVEYWVQTALVLFGCGLLFLLLNFLK